MSGAPFEPSLFDTPALPYPDAESGRSSGWSGSETSRERAREQDADGTTGERQQAVLRWLRLREATGATWKELAEAQGWHHGQASGALSTLHKVGAVARLAEERRHRCAVYVLPEWVGGRPVAVQGRKRDHDLDEALDALADAIGQACLTSARGGEPDYLDSGALSAYADGMRLLARHGRLRITHEYGRRVIAVLA